MPFLVVVVIAALGASLSAFDLILSPIFRRVAVRSIVRRLGEAGLIVLGAMLGTAIIAAALIVGDSFTGSIRDIARTSLGPVDLSVDLPAQDDIRTNLLRLEDRIAHLGIDDADGVLPAVTSAAVLENGREGDERVIDPSNCLMEIDFASARRFGPDAGLTGLTTAGSTPTGDETVISQETADLLRVQVGERLTAHLYGASVELTVRDVVPTVGLAGFCGALVPPGTIEERWTASKETVQPPNASILVSLAGGVFDTVDSSPRAAEQLESGLEGTEWATSEIVELKANRLERADRSGSSLRTIFSGIGGFSVISGILLLINLLVMLAEERKVELGVMRALGLKRHHLLRVFSLEGSIYAAAASVAGSLTGIGVGWLVIVGTQQIFAERNASFRIDLFVLPSTLATAALIGFALSLITIWATSLRIARLNIISAIRDLPDPRRSHRRWLRTAAGAAAVFAGLGASWIGVRSGSQLALLSGVPIAAFTFVALTARLRFARVVALVGPSIAIAWTLGAFVLFTDKMDHAGIAVFVVMGVLLVTAAVIIAVTIGSVWGTLAARRGGQFGLALRLGVAYPLARRVRTGLLLAMFSLVVFTMVFLASLAATIQGQSSSAAGESSAGYDLIIDANRSNPIDTEAISTIDGVESVAGLLRGAPEFTNRYEAERTRWGVTGLDPAILRFEPPALGARLSRFPSDRAAFEAALDDPTLIIVDDEFLLRGAGPRSDGPEPGDRVRAFAPDGATRTLTVAAVLRSDAVGSGSWWQRSALEEFMAPAVVQSRTYVKVSGTPANPARIAEVQRSLAAELIDRGAEVSTFEAVVADELSRTTSFIRLLEGYLGFGLLIGIAGLGVVLVRAVRERRREIGMLRAMGVSSRVVHRAFLVEAMFIAVQGALIGGTLALVTAYQVVVNSSAFSLSADSFTIPWLAVIVIMSVPTLAALVAAWRPASAAARVRPAVALRVTD